MQQKEINDIALKKCQELNFLANPSNPQENLIILIHAINLSFELICTGTMEDDPVENYILPPNWEKHIDNIYSFRYMNDKKENFYFKLIHEPEANLIEINAVSSNRPDTIVSDRIDNISLFNKPIGEPDLRVNSVIKNYQSKILSHLLKALNNQKEEPKKPNLFERPPNPNDFFWNRPRNVEPTPYTPSLFGDFGSSDLRPIPLGGGGISSGGSLLGPNNPIFTGINNPNNSNNNNPNFSGPLGPNIRFDPFGPNGINGSFPEFDGGFSQNPRFGGGSGFGMGNNGFF